MKFREIKNPALRYAKSFLITDDYVVLCTGRGVSVLDRELRLLRKAEGLSYVYKAALSPDKGTLLLISTGAVFYLVDMDSFAVERHVLRGKYNGNLEGRGCWSLDGGSFYIPVFNQKTFSSTLRRYNFRGFGKELSHVDLFPEKYSLFDIEPVPELGKYLLVGQREDDGGENGGIRSFLLWFDSESLEELPFDGEFDAVRAEYDPATGSVFAYDHSVGAVRYGADGKFIKAIPAPEAGTVTVSFSDVFKNIELLKDSFGELKAMCGALGLDNVSSCDTINKLCFSHDGKIVYIATELAIFAVDAASHEIIAKEPVKYGAHDIKEISPGVVAVELFGSVKLFRLC